MEGYRTLRTVVFLSLVAACTCPSAIAQEGSEGPRIKFLDDVFCWGEGCRRDPWEERIETERHDFTQSTATVGCGVSQIEMGYSYFYKDADEEIDQSHTTPEMMLRLGVSDDIEFRMRWVYAWQFAHEGHADGSAEDLKWAIKLGMTDQDGWLPESALELRFTVPTGGSAFSTERFEWGLDYIYDWQISEKCWFYGSSGMGTNGLGDFGLIPEEPAAERFVVWTQSFAVQLELTERTAFYSEFYGLFSQNLEDDYSIVMYNVGVDYYVTNDLVLDFRIGTGLTADSDDLFAGIGGGFRF